MKIPLIMQMHTGENGIATLSMMLGTYKKFVTSNDIRKKCSITRNGVSVKELCNTAESYNLDTEILDIKAKDLYKEKLPVVALWKRKYYVIIKGIKRGNVNLVDAAKGVYSMSLEAFEKKYLGKIIRYKPNKNFTQSGKPKSQISMIYNRVKNYKPAILFTIALNLIVVVFSLLQVQFKKNIIDLVLVRKDLSIFLLLSIILISYSIIIFAINSIKTVNLYGVSRKMSASYGGKLFKKLLHLPYSFYEENSKGELMERIETNLMLDNSLISSFVPKLIAGLMTFLYFFLLFQYNYIMAILCLIIELLFIICTFLFQKRRTMILRNTNMTSGTLNASTLNGLSLIEAIKSTGSEQNFFQMWNKSQYLLWKSKKFTIRLDAVLNSIDLIHSLATSTLLTFLGAWFIINGNITMGILSAFQSVNSSLGASLNSLLSLINVVQTTSTSIERIDDIYERDTRPPVLLKSKDPDKILGTLNVNKVWFSYNNDKNYVLKDISFKVNQGEMVAIVGASGCGKSTLLKLISDMYEPTKGEILYDNKKRNDIPDIVFRSSLTSVDQEIMLFEDSIYNNLCMWDSTIYDFEMVMAAEDANIYDRISKESNSFDTMIYENGKNFSGGEKQRLELARALCLEPSIILLDEFSSALDSLTEKIIFENIKQKRVTCIIAAHRLSTVKQCDKIIIIENGQISAAGTHEELYKGNDYYRRLVDLD